MFPALKQTWWLWALCGIADAVSAALNLLMRNPDGSLTLRRFALPSLVWDLSILAIVAGACALAAGLWIAGKGMSWLLSLHGLALAAFGIVGISPLVRGPLSFRPISLLFVLMSLSVSAFSWGTAQTPRSSAAERWFLSLSGLASIAFALSFLAVGFGWVRLGPPHYWIWMALYFAFCAIFMAYLAMLPRARSVSRSAWVAD